MMFLNRIFDDSAFSYTILWSFEFENIVKGFVTMNDVDKSF